MYTYILEPIGLICTLAQKQKNKILEKVPKKLREIGEFFEFEYLPQ
jgi:hypothetical protein